MVNPNHLGKRALKKGNKPNDYMFFSSLRYLPYLLFLFTLFQNEAGWIGFYATIAGIGAGLILARCADLFGGKMKALLLVLFFGSSGCFLWFSLLCLRMIQYDESKMFFLVNDGTFRKETGQRKEGHSSLVSFGCLFCAQFLERHLQP